MIRDERAPLTQEQIASWIEVMIDRIVQRFDPLRILLFGSRAAGRERPWSDVDLLVVLPELGNRRAVVLEIRRALADSPLPKDVIVTTPEEIENRRHVVGSLLRTALREGKVLYARP